MYFWRVGGKFVSLVLDPLCSFHMKTLLRSAFTSRNAVLKDDRVLEPDTSMAISSYFAPRSSICCTVKELHCISMHFYSWLSVSASPAFP